MNVLVTGGAGFIGSHFCDFIIGLPDLNRLVVVDKLTYAGLKLNLNHCLADPRSQFIQADICYPKDFQEVLLSSDFIFNFAAESHVDNSISGPKEFIQTNIWGTFQLLEQLRNSQSSARFIQISTDEVYGSLQGGDSSSTEESPLKPSSPYSSSKASADLLALSYYFTYGLNILVTRSSNNYGPRQLPEKLLPKVIGNARAEVGIPVYGNGKNIRDWIFVEDNCKGIWQAAHKGEAGNVYHFGSGEEVSNIELVKKVLKIMNKEESLIQFVEDRKGHDFRYSLSTKITQKKLNWKPQMSHQQGLNKTVEWYLENSSWWEVATERLLGKNKIR